MAARHKSSIQLEPERKLAVLFANEKRLSPPVDVETSLHDIATVEDDSIPADCDAILLTYHNRKPRIIVSDNSPPTRRAFTLAHELGHIVIPWQIGSVFCHVDFAYVSDDLLAREVEAQANRFASELLIPTTWALQELADSALTTADYILDIARKARVSAPAALFSAARLFAPGYLFVITNELQQVQYVTRSPDSECVLPVRGSDFDVGLFSAETITTSSATRSTLYAIQFATRRLSPLPRKSTTSCELLSEILNELYTSRSEARKTQQRIDGIVGSANSNCRDDRSPESLYLMFRMRFGGRGNLADVILHPRFDLYLRTKAQELGEGTRK